MSILKSNLKKMKAEPENLIVQLLPYMWSDAVTRSLPVDGGPGRVELSVDGGPGRVELSVDGGPGRVDLSVDCSPGRIELLDRVD